MIEIIIVKLEIHNFLAIRQNLNISMAIQRIELAENTNNTYIFMYYVQKKIINK